MAFSLLGDAVRDATVGRSVSAVALRPTLRRESRRSQEQTAGIGHPGNHLLEVNGLNVAVRAAGAETALLHDVTFAVSPGEAVGIVGESGCGKSTTARAILGLLPAEGHVTAGSIMFEGADLTTLSEKAMSKIRGSGIALISQDAINGLDPVYTVGNQLREVIRRHTALDRSGARARAVELLRLVRFSDPDAIMHRRAHELSGGMAQRVGIAMALAGEPKILIADEPTSALDVTVQADILGLLRELRQKLGMALILVTHDWGVLADTCDRVIVMYAGEVVETSGLSQIYTAPCHPYSDALLSSNPQLVAPGQVLPTIPGQVPMPGSWPAGCHFEPRCPMATDACGAVPIDLQELPGERTSRCIHVEQLSARR
jgi:peptide/nickel transport system permease protein